MKTFFIKIILIVHFAFFVFFDAIPQKNSNTKLPNIIFILTDDLGYGDIGVLYQNQRKKEGKPYHKTPNLDKMAKQGMLLTRHYAPAPVCAPSRASLLRGVHQGNAEIRNNQFDKALPNNHTLASVLKEAGYATAIIGKYGLQGRGGESPETWEAYPTKRGFDYFFGYVRHVNGHNHYPAHKVAERPPMKLYSGNDEISSQLKGCYTTDLFTAMAKKWIIDQKDNSPEQPFFIYLAYDTPHAGLEVASTAYPEGRGLKGGMQYLGQPGKYINTVADTIDTYLHPDYADKDWPMVHKKFASMVRRIDNCVEDIFQLLKDLNIDEETMVVFTSDNGPHDESYGYGDYAPTLFESFGVFDGIKRDTWEGGIRVPAIVRWPGQIPSNTKNDTPTGFHDWLPTFSQMAGLPAPAITDGVSLLPILTNKGERKNGNVYIEYSVYGATPEYETFHKNHAGLKRGEMQVIYLDGYKGVRYNILSASDDFLIYDTKNDPEEQINLASKNEYFTGLQKRMKDKVLQMRVSNSSAPRPYDSLPVPSLNINDEAIEKGIKYAAYNLNAPWVPDIKTLNTEAVKSGIRNAIDLKPGELLNEFVLFYEGLLFAPEAGEYQFELVTDGGVVLRIHDAAVIDADKMYQKGSVVQSKIMLEKGYHPIRVIYKNGNENAPSLKLDWSGPGFDKREFGSGDLFVRGSVD